MEKTGTVPTSSTSRRRARTPRSTKINNASRRYDSSRPAPQDPISCEKKRSCDDAIRGHRAKVLMDGYRVASTIRVLNIEGTRYMCRAFRKTKRHKTQHAIGREESGGASQPPGGEGSVSPMIYRTSVLTTQRLLP